MCKPEIPTILVRQSVNMNFTVKTFIAKDGERFSQLYDADDPGFPLFYPTAFIARSVRPSTTHETQKAYLSTIKRICEWESRRKLDLANNFHRRQFLSAAHIDDLANYLRASKIGGRGTVISSQKYNTHITYAANYLYWLAQELITESNTLDIRDALESQNTMLMNKRRRKFRSKSANEQRILAARLPDEARSLLLDLFQTPFKGLNQPHDFGPRLRNIVMIRILYETGMRRGELLSIKLRNFIEAGGEESAYLDIERNHNDIVDTRLHQPVAKTLGRRLPISEGLEKQIQLYREQWRAEVPGTGFRDEDFLFIVHRAGRSQGKALPTTAFSSGIMQLKLLFSDLATVHPHLLRHDWNYRFSLKADSEGIPFEEERALREQLMGWAPGSPTSLLYNRRYIQEKALEIGLKIASNTARIIR